MMKKPRFFQVKQIKHLNLLWKFYLKRGKQNEMADGMRSDLFYGFVRELAAGCYKSEK